MYICLSRYDVMCHYLFSLFYILCLLLSSFINCLMVLDFVCSNRGKLTLPIRRPSIWLSFGNFSAISPELEVRFRSFNVCLQILNISI